LSVIKKKKKTCGFGLELLRDLLDKAGLEHIEVAPNP